MRVCILGLGKMGTAAARRFQEKGHVVSIWNRSRVRTNDLLAERSPSPFIVASTPADAIAACTRSAVVLLLVSSIPAACSVLRQGGVGTALKGRTLVNLVSGNPDEGREVARLVAEISDGEAKLLDGAYCGPPKQMRSGQGQLFVSGEQPKVFDDVASLLSLLGTAEFCGDIGTSRALDYAVVDLAFVNLLSFMSNAAMLEREGVDMEQFFRCATGRLANVPGSLKLHNMKMASRNESDYLANPTATLKTWRNFWASRLPYNNSHGIPSHLTNFAVQLLDDASGGMEGTHADADVTRLQEIVRHGKSSL